MRFAIKNGGGEQFVQTAPLTVGAWTHVAVTLGGGSAKIYVNGELAATNNAVTIRPGDFDPKFNYLGESQFAADPLFRGRLDDVHVADYVLTPAQIAGLMTNAAPQFSAASIVRGPAPRGTAFSGTVADLATDADAGDALSFSKIKGPAWLTVAPDGTLGGTPPLTETARQEFVLRATDSRGASAFTVMTMFLTAPASEAASAMAAPSAGSGGGELPDAWSLAQLMSVDAAFDEPAGDAAILDDSLTTAPSIAKTYDAGVAVAGRVTQAGGLHESYSDENEIQPRAEDDWEQWPMNRYLTGDILAR
jgi:hypothetical protein